MTTDQVLLGVLALCYVGTVLWFTRQVGQADRRTEVLAARVEAMAANQAKLFKALTRHGELISAGLGVPKAETVPPQSVGLVSDDDETDEIEEPAPELVSFRPVIPSHLIRQKEAAYFEAAMKKKERK